MKKLPSEASNRLMNILYSKTAPKVATTTSKLSKTLYDDNTGTDPSYYDLISRPILHEAPDLVKKYNPDSNILKFNCLNSYITKQDFLRVFPRNSQFYREFSVGTVPLEVVKSRNPHDLTFQQAYYLVFPSQLLACIYLHETSTKMLNGFHLNFEFAKVDEVTLATMSSPLINTGYSKLLKTIPQHSTDNYKLIAELISSDARSKTVKIQNLPFKLPNTTLRKLLHDYTFQRLPPITIDVNNETNIQLMRFGDVHQAQRFVRNFHGKKWDKIDKRKPEQQFYEPILCEIVD
ncbi:uncharacterized protein SPAPADRAFT_58906 [Spathaspora passalidarum NRRL Y-27907]|uniref:Uncharacterized protein n=1 Tax=Spathaspora passalidarum (strain NRRL Y-27907 / 11-Y1) TaxID=619300 RepID=G3AEB8_SPAPN|nr:uncharacterized protein SPAPADRAFT_58906 [Spathaspora passalidarum NRRL Y-27907]EGW35705.1 hypothetical protein SPAPADRAFT_58906 [Spathaspora passalidarum NRRL Y-27907]